jgi:hypothetical protein
MKARVKRLPRLWCALQGLLPLKACLAAQRGELAWPQEDAPVAGEKSCAAPVSRSSRKRQSGGVQP